MNTMLRKVTKLLIAVALIALAAALYPALGKPGKKKLNVTVYPFKAAGASEATAEALTSITTYELGKSNKIRVIREEIRSVSPA